MSSDAVKKGPGTGATLVAVCVALGAVTAAMASLNVALPSIARATHASQTELEWIIDAYSLIFASLLLPAGSIGDRYGRRRALLVGLGIFGAASIVAMTANSAAELILLRGVLGGGGALVMPATLSTITTSFGEAERARAVSVWAGVAGGSAIVSLIVSGLLLQEWSWRSVFAVNVVLAISGILLTLRYVPESSAKDRPRIDFLGASIGVVGLVAIVYSVIQAPDQGWASVRTLGGLLGGAVVMAIFVVVELRKRTPLLDPRLFKDRRLSGGSFSIFAQFFSFFGFVFVSLQYLQIVRSWSPLLSAVSVFPNAVAMMVASRLSPALAARFGRARVVCVGLFLIAGGILVMSRFGLSTPYTLNLAGLLLLGTGLGISMTPATSSITESLSVERQGVGSALNDLSRELGSAVGIAVVGSLLAASYKSHFQISGASPAVAADAKSSLGNAVAMGGHTATAARSAFVSGIHVSLFATAIFALVSAVVAGTLLRKPRGATEEETLGSLHASPSKTPLVPDSLSPATQLALSQRTLEVSR